MRTLVIAQVWPEPTASAAGVHLMSLLRCIHGWGWPLRVASAAKPGAHRHPLEALGIECAEIELNSSRFDEQITRWAPELVLFDRFLSEEQFGWRVAASCPDALQLIDTEDLHALRHARETAPRVDTVTTTMGKHQLLSDRLYRELASIYRADLSLIISSEEERLLRDGLQVPARQLHQLPFLIDLSPTEETRRWGDFARSPLAERPYESRADFVTIGNLRHPPNIDALRWLRAEIWPLIRAQLPKAKLHAYGAYTSGKAQALHAPREGFLIKGWAPSAESALAEARVCLAPLRFGAGLKGKLISACCVGTPSVTTSIGAEGLIEDPDAWPGVIADDAASLATSAVQLHEEQGLWVQAQRRCAQLIKLYDREPAAAALRARIEGLWGELRAHRAQNHIGAMLRHHQLHSARSLSRWIEEKSKRQALEDRLRALGEAP